MKQKYLSLPMLRISLHREIYFSSILLELSGLALVSFSPSFSTLCRFYPSSLSPRAFSSSSAPFSLHGTAKKPLRCLYVSTTKESCWRLFFLLWFNGETFPQLPFPHGPTWGTHSTR